MEEDKNKNKVVKPKIDEKELNKTLAKLSNLKYRKWLYECICRCVYNQ